MNRHLSHFCKTGFYFAHIAKLPSGTAKDGTRNAGSRGTEAFYTNWTSVKRAISDNQTRFVSGK